MSTEQEERKRTRKAIYSDGYGLKAAIYILQILIESTTL
jgi:hypothetical protein